MSSPVNFIKDRASFIALFLSYHLITSTTLSQQLWTKLITNFSEFNITLFGTAIVSIIFYMSFSSVLAYIDFMMMPSSTALELKVQPKYQPTWFDYSKAIPVVLFNLVVLGVPYGYFMFYIFHPTSAFNNKSGQLYFTELPNTGKVMFDVMICVLIEEILFYYSHRLFHLPFFYSKFHKKHHEFTAPIGISAVYTTPLDFLVSNITPLLVGPIVLQSHPVTVWVYFIVAIINTVITHGGYTIPGFPNPKLHDFHHETFNNMYGVIGLLDFVHGTDDKFRSRYNKIDTKAE